MLENNVMVIDVETTGGLDNPLTYDIGLIIYNIKNPDTILFSKSFIIKEIFENRKLMNTAYYAEKVPMYKEQIAQGMHEVITFTNARDIINNAITDYNVKTISAYNLAFDSRALQNTTKYLNVSNRFLQKKINLLCIWGFACEVIYTQKTFKKLAEKNNWKTDAGNMKTSAEIGYRYITLKPNFTEAHTGLADVLIEKEILDKAIRQKQKYTGGIIANPWRIPNKKVW